LLNLKNLEILKIRMNVRPTLCGTSIRKCPTSRCAKSAPWGRIRIWISGGL